MEHLTLPAAENGFLIHAYLIANDLTSIACELEKGAPAMTFTMPLWAVRDGKLSELSKERMEVKAYRGFLPGIP